MKLKRFSVRICGMAVAQDYIENNVDLGDEIFSIIFDAAMVSFQTLDQE